MRLFRFSQGLKYFEFRLQISSSIGLRLAGLPRRLFDFGTTATLHSLFLLRKMGREGLIHFARYSFLFNQSDELYACLEDFWDLFKLMGLVALFSASLLS